MLSELSLNHIFQRNMLLISLHVYVSILTETSCTVDLDENNPVFPKCEVNFVQNEEDTGECIVYPTMLYVHKDVPGSTV